MPLTSRPLAPLLGMAALLYAGPVQAGVSGGAGVVSRYLWGGVVMSEDPAVQGRLEYRHRTGLHAGVWASTLDTGASGNTQVDFSAGYGGSRGDLLRWDAGLVYHHFTGGAPADNDASVPRAYASLSYGPLTVLVKRAMDDASWTAEGDIYASIGLSQPLPWGFTASARSGFYRFAGDAVRDDGTVTTPRRQKAAFRDADFALSRPLGPTGVELSLHYTIGGELRDGTGLADHFWAGLQWSFD